MTFELAKYPGTVVPIEEAPLPDLRAYDDLAMALSRIYVDGIPGFVIRESIATSDPRLQYGPELACNIIDTLPAANVAMGKHLNFEVGIPLKLGVANTIGIGDFHHDSNFGDDWFRLRIQNTVQGAGKAILTTTGILGFDATTTTITYPRHAARDPLLAMGLVDPEIVNPLIYTTQLSQGDSVVFAPSIPRSQFHDREGDVWHRFDASLVPREGSVVVIRPSQFVRSVK